MIVLNAVAHGERSGSRAGRPARLNTPPDVPFGIWRFRLIRSEDAVPTEGSAIPSLPALWRTGLGHMPGGVPPRAPPDGGTGVRSLTVQSCLDQPGGAGSPTLPLPPDDDAQLPSDPLFQRLQGRFHFRQAVIRHPAPKHRREFVRSLIRTGVGRASPTGKPPAGHYRRRMQWELAGSQKGKAFAQRAQAETVMSMLKRNLGDALRARSPRMRRREHAFKAVVHDLMLARRHSRGSRQSPPDPVLPNAILFPRFPRFPRFCYSACGSV